MARILSPVWIAFLCLFAQDQSPVREDAQDLEILDGAITKIDDKDRSSPDYLAQYHPLQFLEMGLERYKREVRGYSCIFRKVERIHGKLRPLEKIQVHFREEPFSVYFHWIEGAGLARKVLYVKGENNNKVLGLPVLAFLGVKERDVDGADAKNTGRITIDQFGIYLGAKRTLDSMRRAEARGTLHLEYKGVKAVPQVGDRMCHIFVRKPYDPVEDLDGVNELTIFIDQETFMQVGSILRDAHENLLAEYFFRDIQLNPTYPADQFQRSILK